MGAEDCVRADDARSIELLEIARKSFDPATKIIAVSGGFDPLHIGHVRMIQDAAKRGLVAVILNSDAWLKRKKGFSFMSWHERYTILMALRDVRWVFPAEDEDGTVCKTLRKLHPHFFANGGDRKSAESREHRVCREYGIQEIFGVGGGKIQSSSELTKKVRSA